MNITESNKLIAEFLGWNKSLGITYHKDNKVTTLKHFDFVQNKDWNGLMEVVEKIESKGFDVHINTCVCRISDVGEDRFEDIETFNSNNKIQAVYSGVVEFINWYNTQQTK